MNTMICLLMALLFQLTPDEAEPDDAPETAWPVVTTFPWVRTGETVLELPGPAGRRAKAAPYVPPTEAERAAGLLALVRLERKLAAGGGTRLVAPLRRLLESDAVDPGRVLLALARAAQAADPDAARRYREAARRFSADPEAPPEKKSGKK